MVLGQKRRITGAAGEPRAGNPVHWRGKTPLFRRSADWWSAGSRIGNPRRWECQRLPAGSRRSGVAAAIPAAVEGGDPPPGDTAPAQWRPTGGKPNWAPWEGRAASRPWAGWEPAPPRLQGGNRRSGSLPICATQLPAGRGARLYGWRDACRCGTAARTRRTPSAKALTGPLRGMPAFGVRPLTGAFGGRAGWKPALRRSGNRPGCRRGRRPAARRYGAGAAAPYRWKAELGSLGGPRRAVPGLFTAPRRGAASPVAGPGWGKGRGSSRSVRGRPG